MNKWRKEKKFIIEAIWMKLHEMVNTRENRKIKYFFSEFFIDNNVLLQDVAFSMDFNRNYFLESS